MKNLFPVFAFVLALVASSFTLSESTSIASNATPAAFDAFLKLDGIPGESTAAGHKQWILLESCSVNLAQKTIAIERTKTPVSSPKLAAAAAQGKVIKRAILHVRKAGGDYLQYELENVLISNYQISGAASRPMESLSINFEEVKF